MKQEFWLKFKMFLWDQLVRPFKMLMKLGSIKILLIFITLFSILYERDGLWDIVFWISIILLLVLIVYDDIYLYIRSGEFIANYRNEKYPSFRKVMKEIKKEKSEGLNSYNSLNKNEGENQNVV